MKQAFPFRLAKSQEPTSLTCREYAKIAFLASLFLLLMGSPALAENSTQCILDRFGDLSPELSMSLRLRQIAPEFSRAYRHIRKIPPELIRGDKTPRWKDFDILRKIISNIRAGKKTAAEKGQLDELQAALVEIEKSVPDRPALVALRDASKGARPINTNQPTEHELKRVYQHLLWELNRELPPGLKIRGVRLPPDPRRKALVEQARAMIRKQEENFAALYSTCGYPSEAALIEGIKAHGAEAVRILDMLQKERVEAVIRLTENGRWGVSKMGFQNQRITGSSRGSLDPNRRDRNEATLTFDRPSVYKDYDPDLKPKYGYLRPSPKENEVLVEDTVGPSQYGPDLYVLDLSRVRDRLTWTAGDSLTLILSHTGDEMRPMRWDDAFVPWKDRALLTPTILPGENEITFRPRSPDLDKMKTLKGFRRFYNNNRYVELQFWGPVTLDDVAVFEFKETPPAGQFLQELQKRNIKIRDGRGAKTVDWVPGNP